MKVLLVNPPRYNELIGNNPEIIEEERGHNPPLGLLYLAGYLEKYSDHEVAVLDAQAEELTYEQLEQSLAQKQADVVGIEAMTFTLIDVIKTVQLVKKVSPETKVVLGGPHVHIYPEETINLPGVDFLVLGEGERSFHYLLDHIHKPDQLKEMRGFVFKENGKVINTGISDSIYDLDSLPFPARHLTDITRYSSLLAKRDIVTTMFTSRGCPYRCTFCDRPFSPVIGREFRYRSAKNIVDEMEACTHMGIYEFLIYDDTFSVRKDRVMDMCEEILRRKLKVGWDVRAHVNTVTPDLLKAMKKAGCELETTACSSSLRRTAPWHVLGMLLNGPEKPAWKPLLILSSDNRPRPERISRTLCVWHGKLTLTTFISPSFAPIRLRKFIWKD
jgi:anaerobic magnesium-protoporphyrin IX monomethyl ester cyclase